MRPRRGPVRRFEHHALGAATTLLLLAIAVNSSANPILMPAPAAPVPTADGTGLSSQWVNGTIASDYQELDRALTFITPAAYELDGVGPVSFSNDLAILGDFSTHTTMPYSLHGTPAANGWYLATKMTGEWAAREAGTYTFAIGADDGYRVTLGGLPILSHPPAQSFRRAAASFTVTEPGLYPIVVEYFNEVEEGVVELSFATGDVAIDSAFVPLPSSFELVPLKDLYPPDAIDQTATADAGAGASASSDGGASGSSGATRAPDATSPAGESWHGGGCAVGVARSSVTPSWAAGVAALLLGAMARLRRNPRNVDRRHIRKRTRRFR